MVITVIKSKRDIDIRRFSKKLQFAEYRMQDESDLSSSKICG